MLQSIFNALAMGTTVPVLWITLWVLRLYGPSAIETMNAFVFDKSCRRIPPRRLLILGVILLFSVMSIESFIWLTGFALNLKGDILNTRPAGLAYTISFTLRQWVVVCSGILYTVAGLRAENPRAYVGHVGYSVLTLIVGFTSAHLIWEFCY